MAEPATHHHTFITGGSRLRHCHDYFHGQRPIHTYAIRAIPHRRGVHHAYLGFAIEFILYEHYCWVVRIMLNNRNFVVGLTGGIGSGKSTVAAMFLAYGIEVVDADQLAREVVNPGTDALQQISKHFGEAILDPDAELNRQKLREIVFSDTAEKDWLEKLLHPLIAELMKTRLENSTSVYCILESPLLLESNQHEMVNRILLVDVSEQIQLSRTLQRDQSNAATIKAIIAAQISREERRKRADDIIENETDIDALQIRVAELHEKYTALAKQYE